MDTELLSRIQFAVTVGFHFIFPPISIGLAFLLIFLERLGWKRNDEQYLKLAKFFGKLLGINFAVGVATGIVMVFQFGTNWSNYSAFVGDIFGAPLAAEAIFAFFLESTFLGIYLFGRNRISKGWHFFSICMVALGSLISAFWIIVANSWQQTPAGYILNPVTGRAELANFFEAVFNPSTLVRFFHTVDAAFITGAFFITGVCAYLILKKKETDTAHKGLKFGIIAGIIFSLLQVFPFGHEHAREMYRNQPEKFAAIMGLYNTQTEAPIMVFAYPTKEGEQPVLKAPIEIPKLLSYLVFFPGEFQAFKGVADFPKDDIPPLWLTFVSYHNMVLLGMIFILLMIWGAIQMKRKKLLFGRKYLKLLLWAIPFPVIACQLGWMAAEVGRQPWIVYHLLRTHDAYSPTVASGEVWFSLILFSLIYLLIGILFVYLLAKEIKKGPETSESIPEVKEVVA
jgi:cytochrome d ubiquinol oxidase subunit I